MICVYEVRDSNNCAVNYGDITTREEFRNLCKAAKEQDWTIRHVSTVKRWSLDRLRWSLVEDYTPGATSLLEISQFHVTNTVTISCNSQLNCDGDKFLAISESIAEKVREYGNGIAATNFLGDPDYYPEVRLDAMQRRYVFYSTSDENQSFCIIRNTDKPGERAFLSPSQVKEIADSYFSDGNFNACELGYSLRKQYNRETDSFEFFPGEEIASLDDFTGSDDTNDVPYFDIFLTTVPAEANDLPDRLRCTRYSYIYLHPGGGKEYGIEIHYRLIEEVTRCLKVLNINPNTFKWEQSPAIA